MALCHTHHTCCLQYAQAQNSLSVRTLSSISEGLVSTTPSVIYSNAKCQAQNKLRAFRGLRQGVCLGCKHKTRRRSTGRGGRWVTLSIILNSEGNVKSAPSMARMDMNMSSKNISPRRLFTPATVLVCPACNQNSPAGIPNVVFHHDCVSP